VSSGSPVVAPLTLAQAAELLSGGRGEAGRQLRRAVDAQLLRRGVSGADRDDVRADVAFSLLLSTRSEVLSLDAACAHVALVARNKAVDLHRRARNEAPEGALAERAASGSDGVLQRDLDAVSGEVHRRDVSRALVELVRELPPAERLALTATASGTGHAGSGLGRSSHYRALDRARLRLSAVVRSRVAGGLVLPAFLHRTVERLRALVLPVGATAAAAIASAAFVLPAITPPSPRLAPSTVAPRLARATISVARLAPVARPAPVAVQAPPHLLHRRRMGVHMRKVAAVHAVAPRQIARRPAVPSAPAAVVPAPAAGLDPCRAAQLCQ
jgi:DNA-directed RNA polymerase specialized sigma24 family protein